MKTVTTAGSLMVLLAVSAAVSGVVAAEGRAELEPATESRYQGVLAWICGFPLSDGNRAAFHQALRDEWRISTAEELAGVGPFIGSMEQAMAAEPLSREVSRLKFRKEVLSRAKADASKSPLARFLLAAERKAHPPLTKEAPALTREAVEGLFAINSFVVADLNGAPEPAVSPTDLDRAVSLIKQHWAKLSVQQRQAVTDFPLQVATLRSAWPSVSDERKETTRAAWRKRLEAAAQRSSAATPDPEDGTVKDDSTPQAEVSKPGNSRTARAAKSAREQEQEMESDLMISKMQHQIHEMNMEIIRNMGGGHTRTIYFP